jgi:hypothetical protein
MAECCAVLLVFSVIVALVYAIIAFSFGIKFTFQHDCNVKTDALVQNVQRRDFGRCLVSFIYWAGDDIYAFEELLQCTARNGMVYIEDTSGAYNVDNGSIPLCHGYVHPDRHVIFEPYNYVSVKIAIMLLTTGAVILAVFVIMLCSYLVAKNVHRRPDNQVHAVGNVGNI